LDKIAETILNNLPVGLLIIEADGKIIEANPSACQILGCPSNGFVGKSWGDVFLAPHNNPEFTEVVLAAIQKETPKIERITPYHAPDGTKKYLSIISSAQRENNKITAIVILFEDMTELYQMHDREKHILEQNHKLATLRAESLILFARSVAHQIRNPITTIAGFSRLLARNADETSREPLTVIEEETHKLEAIVLAVDEYSTIALGTILPVNLWMIIEEAKHHITNHPAALNQEIEWELECPDMSIKVDHKLISQALSEIFLNALDFAGPKTKIQICAKEETSNITITITDSGAGFTPDGLKMAFDPFFTTKSVGAGMGLTRAKRIVNEHQGNISIKNKPDNGGQVTIVLPMEPF
jgi:PAS domain S-box-containing protein